jgi:hypothetical protein
MKTKTSASILLLISTVALGQQKEQLKDTVNRITIQDVYIQSGTVLEKNAYGMVSDFQKLVPQSILLNNNFANYTSTNNTITNTAFSAMIGIKFRNNKQTAYKSNPLLRLGISYFSGTNLSTSLSKNDYKTFDTLTSTKTGQTVYNDSLTSQKYNMQYAAEQLRFDVSLIFRTNTKARWSLYGGVGISSGFSFNAITNITYTKNFSTTLFPNGSNNKVPNSNREEQTEEFKNKSTFVFSSYLPIGIDFRLGRKKDFWKKLHLYYEARPYISFNSVPELSTLVRAGLQSSFGLRLSW